MNTRSGVALLLCAFLLLTTSLIYYPKWKHSNTEATISWDVSGYYLYLPSTFIYHDFRQLTYKDRIMAQYRPTPDFQQAFRHPSGNYVFKYTCGQALMLSPFFLAAHGYASAAKSYPADGFSRPYQFAVSIGTLLYALTGLFVLRRFLLRYFSDKAVAGTLLALVFASNFLEYATLSSAYTHNSLFLVYALLLLATDDYYRSPSFGKAALTGFLVGLATLIRPTEAIALLLPALWAARGSGYSITGFWRRHWAQALVAAITGALVFSIQIVYWKAVSGEWLVYSYGNEGFDFASPHVLDCLFSYRAGWLVYTPVMLLAIAGFRFLYRKDKVLFRTSFFFTLVFAYLCFSWHEWWYGASLGQRGMVQAYPVLALPLCAFCEWVDGRSRVWRAAVWLFAVFCGWYNIWLTHQAHLGGLYMPGEMNGPYFRAVFGKSGADPQTLILLDNGENYSGSTANPMRLYRNDFETDSLATITGDEAIEGRSTYVGAGREFTPEYEAKLPPPQRKWVRAAADFRTWQKEWTAWKMPQMVLRFYYKGSLEKVSEARVERLLSEGYTNRIYLDAGIPEHYDRVTVFFWKAGTDKKLVIDNLEVVAY